MNEILSEIRTVGTSLTTWLPDHVFNRSARWLLYRDTLPCHHLHVLPCRRNSFPLRRCEMCTGHVCNKEEQKTTGFLCGALGNLCTGERASADAPFCHECSAADDPTLWACRWALVSFLGLRCSCLPIRRLIRMFQVLAFNMDCEPRFFDLQSRHLRLLLLHHEGAGHFTSKKAFPDMYRFVAVVLAVRGAFCTSLRAWFSLENPVKAYALHCAPWGNKEGIRNTLMNRLHMQGWYIGL